MGVQYSNQDLALLLVDSGCFKTGEFKLKSGLTSSYYIDLREVTHHLELCDLVATKLRDQLLKLAPAGKQLFVAGIPYGVWPVAAQAAREARLCFYQVRKETKDYGRKTDMSAYKDSEFILIEDVMSSGSSIIETIKKMEGLTISNVIVIVDRELGGEENLGREYPNIKLHSLLKASEIQKLASTRSN